MKYLICLLLLSCSVQSIPQAQHQMCFVPELVITETVVHSELDPFVSDAIKWWNTQIGSEILIDADDATLPTSNEIVSFIAIRIAPPELLKTWKPATGAIAHRFYGGIYPNRCVRGTAIWIKDSKSRSEKILYLIILHELGHALGFGHSNIPNTVMYHEISASTLPRLGKDTLLDIKRGISFGIWNKNRRLDR